MITPPILAIDYGKKHIGIAVTDSTGLIATPITVIHITKKITWEKIIEDIQSVINDYGVKSILFGTPQMFESKNTENTDRIERFINAINDSLHLPYLVYDESYSTKDAENIIINNGSSLRKRKKNIDGIAASIFLQEYIDNMRSNSK